jgi:hypothetical protein
VSWANGHVFDVQDHHHNNDQANYQADDMHRVFKVDGSRLFKNVPAARTSDRCLADFLSAGGQDLNVAEFPSGASPIGS